MLDFGTGLDKINREIKSQALALGNREYCYGNFIPSPNTDIMFVGEMPADDSEWCPRCNFNISWTDRAFQRILVQHGFGGSYVTDIVKTCAEARRLTETEVDEWKTMLKKEIHVIKPKLIIALGECAFLTFQKHQKFFDVDDRFYDKEYLYHPSVWRYPKRRPEFLRRVKRLERYCRECGVL